MMDLVFQTWIDLIFAGITCLRQISDYWVSIIYNQTVNTAFRSSLAKQHQSSNQGQRNKLCPILWRRNGRHHFHGHSISHNCTYVPGSISSSCLPSNWINKWINKSALPRCTSIAIFWIKNWRALLSPVCSMIREPIRRTNERALDRSPNSKSLYTERGA